MQTSAMETQDEKLVTSFLFKKLILDESRQWNIKLLINKVFPDTNRVCKLRFFLNEEPYLSTIERKNDRLTHVIDNKSLFKETYQKDLKDAEKGVADAEKALEEAREKYQDFVCGGTAEEIKYKYKDQDTLVSFIITNDSAVGMVESNLHLDFRHYHIEIIPIDIAFMDEPEKAEEDKDN